MQKPSNAPAPQATNSGRRHCRADPLTFRLSRKVGPQTDHELRKVGFQGLAIASEACSEGRTTHAFFRFKPLIAPVTFSTWPSGHEDACTNTTSNGASTKGSDFNTVWAEHGSAETEHRINTDAKIRIFMIHQAGEIIIADR